MPYIPTFYRQRLGAFAERTAEAAATQFGHLAVAIAADLYDERDEDGRRVYLEPHQSHFLSMVHTIRRQRDGALNTARTAFGADSKTYLAIEHHTRAAMNEALDDELRRLDEFTGSDAAERLELVKANAVASAVTNTMRAVINDARKAVA